MTEQTEHKRDAGNWAQPNSQVKVSNIPKGAINLNVDGRRLSGPLQGFGPMWQKTYRIKIPARVAEPAEVITAWKEHFTDFWMPGDHFYAPLSGLAPGEVALINSSAPGGVPLSTGVMVVYADDVSFTLMTTQGHPFSGWVTFSADTDGDDTTVQAQVLMRANDPMWEMGMRFLGGHRQEDRIWQHTLQAVAEHFKVDAPVLTDVTCVDRKLQWKRAGNMWHNAGIRSGLYLVASPLLHFRAAVRATRRQ